MPLPRLGPRWNERALETARVAKTLDARDPDGITPLWHAVYFGQAAWVTRLLDAGASLDAHDPAKIERALHLVTLWRNVPSPGHAAPTGNGTLLHVAAAHAGSVDVARILLAKKVAIDARDPFGCTALHVAAFHGHAALANALLDAGADVNAIDRAGYSPLDHAAASHDARALLLTRGADPNGGPRTVWPAKSAAQWSIVTNAAHDGQVDLLSALIKAGANLSRHPEALPLAALGGRADAVGLLLRHHAPTNVTTMRNGIALGPLAAAAVAASRSCFDLLWPSCDSEKDAALSAAIDASRGDTKTPPNDHGADRAMLVEWLLAHGADPSSALIAAATLSDTTYLQRLLERGARPDALDGAGEGPLVHAARGGHHRAAALLLAHGADPKARAANGQSAYAIAEDAYRKRSIDDARIVMRAIDDAGGGPPPAMIEPEEPTAGPTVGRIVTHAKFGDGEITAIDGEKLTVVFEGGDRKTLLAKFVTVKH